MSLMIDIPARETYALATGGVPVSKRAAVGAQSSCFVWNANGFARPNHPVTVGDEPLYQCSANVQEGDARNSHEEFQISRREEIDVHCADIHRLCAERLVRVDVQERARGVNELGETRNVLREPVQVVAVTGRDDGGLIVDQSVVVGWVDLARADGNPLH